MKRPQMTPSQLNRARKLIKKECCNYDSDHGECILLDEGDGCVCVQNISYTLLCRWFEEAVLPLDQKLYMDLKPEKASRICQLCGKRFIPAANASRYCPDCALKRRRERSRVCMERLRKKRKGNGEIL